MQTRVVPVDPETPDAESVEEAAALLRAGGLVAFPTETVYGLGANALDEKAVARIFEAKGRPADNPLIVHVPSVDDVARVAREVPGDAQKLAEAFWPGPLTLVLLKRPEVPDAVTAGLDTVAVRVPGHPVARALVTAAGVPVAAPSANRSGRPSPTRAAHVLQDLEGRIDAVVDGGPTRVGLESTVVDLTGAGPVVLRPGPVTVNDLERVLMDRVRVHAPTGTSGPVPSPGMKYRHYAPRAPLVLVEGAPEAAGPALRAELERLTREGLKVGVLATIESGVYGPDALGLGSRADPDGIARDLYARLREADARGFDVILVEGVGPEGLGSAVMERLRRAAERVVRA